MARESKRKRDERRFGKAERLADAMLSLRWGIPSHIPEKLHDQFKARVQNCVDDIQRSVVFNVGNICDYFYSTRDAFDFDWRRDIPCWMPSFPSMFLETSRPSVYFKDCCLPSDFPIRWGWHVMTLKRDLSIPPSADPGNGKPMRLARTLDGISGLYYAYDFPDDHEYVLLLSLVEETPGGWADIAQCSAVIAIRSDGSAVAEPEFASGGVGIGERTELTRKLWELEIEKGRLLAAPVLLALTFLHCKNVAITPVDPPKEINRERKKAGLKPFVRYHTINIEPMKKVLRTEGNIEANGLKKALHLCRGYFAHYTEERPLFGRPGLHGTFWVPAHTRGSLDQGVVISDYNVKAPANP